MLLHAFLLFLSTLATYSTTENHPVVIREEGIAPKIRLSTKTGMPIMKSPHTTVFDPPRFICLVSFLTVQRE